MSENFNQLTKVLEKSGALMAALTLFNWDNETLAPKEAIDNTSKIIGILSNEYFSAVMNDDVKNLLNQLKDETEQLSDNERAIVKKMKKEFESLEVIPQEEYVAFSEILAQASSIWADAKKASDFSKFAPTLQKIVDYQIKFAQYRNKDNKALYDILLDDYEEGMDMKQLDQFFEKLHVTIVPLLKKVVAKNNMVNKDYNFRNYDIAKQKELNHFLAKYIGFDFNKGVLAESEHPFTTNLHNHDVRITTHFYENNLESSIFSVIHEGGHALYEMNIADDLTLTPVGGGASMAMHESQSRFFENVIGRSKAFWIPLWDKLVQMFPENLSNVTLDQFILAINKAQPDLIRTEADELTYSLHIMIRYEIEKLLMSGAVKVEDLPTIWNKKYEEYLGVTPDNDAHGVLQDVHWAGGSFGYFPSYALGNAIAAQIYNFMKKQIPVDEYLTAGNLSSIVDFLKENVHRFGATKNVNEILKDMTGETFNPDYYIQYLEEKYTKLYQL